MRDSVIGLIATFLIMGGGIIGWVAMLVMAFCIYSAVVYERKCNEVVRLRTMLENCNKAVIIEEGMDSTSIPFFGGGLTN